MQRVIELLDKKVETLFNRQDFEYLLENEKLMESEKMAYRHILTEMAEMDDITACDSLNYLCRYLEHAYEKK